MVWRIQAGCESQWLRHGEGTDFQQFCCRDLVAPFASIVLLGVPYHLSAPHCEAAKSQLERLGLVASCAPNSVWLKRAGTNKALPIRWLSNEQHASQFDFQIRNAISLGDNPFGNDGPLAEFVDCGMPFVSVGSDEQWHGLRVGGFEAGSAVILEHLLEALEARTFSGHSLRDMSSSDVATLVARAQQRLGDQKCSDGLEARL